MIYFFMVWGQSYVDSKGVLLSWFPMCCLNLQRMGESCSCHTGNLHVTQGQEHPHPRGTPSVNRFRIAGSFKKEILDPFLRIRSTAQWGQRPVLYEASDDPAAQLVWEPWTGASDHMSQQRKLRRAVSGTSGQCVWVRAPLTRDSAFYTGETTAL